jgi:hypothetical protein
MQDLFGHPVSDRPKRRRESHKTLAARRDWRRANAERERERWRNWARDNREKVKVKRKERWKRDQIKLQEERRLWGKRNPDKIKAYRLKYRYSVSLADYPKPDSCPCCGKQATLVFDHCHRTGKPRGWLCGPCNKLLGWADDDPELLRAAIEYLAKHQEDFSVNTL